MKNPVTRLPFRYKAASVFLFFTLIAGAAKSQSKPDTVSSERRGTFGIHLLALGGVSNTSLQFIKQPNTSYFIDRADLESSTKPLFGMGLRLSFGPFVWTNEWMSRSYIITGYLHESDPNFGHEGFHDYRLEFRYSRLNSGLLFQARKTKVMPYGGVGISWGKVTEGKPGQDYKNYTDGIITSQGHAEVFPVKKDEIGVWLSAGAAWRFLFVEARYEQGSGPEGQSDLKAKSRYWMAFGGFRIPLTTTSY